MSAADAISILPWHEEAFGQLGALQAAERLGHAWLFAGHPGTGKLLLANAFAQSLLCTTPVAGKACGMCQDCHLFAIGAHPDFRLVQPEKKLLVVDQVRDTIEFAQNTSRRGGMKIIVFEPAEAMNLNAANALLKLLEEPPQRTLLLLISHQPGLLLATIRSRCQVLRCVLPPRDMAARWLQSQGFSGDAHAALQRAGGAPLRAVAQNEASAQVERQQVLACLSGLAGGRMQPIEAAKKCEKFGIAATIDYQLACAAELSAVVQRARQLHDVELTVIAEQLHVEQQPATFARLLHRLYGELQDARRVATASNNANPTLLLETLFARWLQLGQRSRLQATN
ncbi:MAG TPA: DNA polymerase III subunit delta' [Pseudomonadales bacterium]